MSDIDELIRDRELVTRGELESRLAELASASQVAQTREAALLAIGAEAAARQQLETRLDKLETDVEQIAVTTVKLLTGVESQADELGRQTREMRQLDARVGELGAMSERMLKLTSEGQTVVSQLMLGQANGADMIATLLSESAEQSEASVRLKEQLEQVGQRVASQQVALDNLCDTLKRHEPVFITLGAAMSVASSRQGRLAMATLLAALLSALLNVDLTAIVMTMMGN